MKAGKKKDFLFTYATIQVEVDIKYRIDDGELEVIAVEMGPSNDITVPMMDYYRDEVVDSCWEDFDENQ